MKVLLSIALLLTKLLRTACFWLEVIIEVGLSSYGRESGKRMLGRNFSPNKKKGRVGEKKKEVTKRPLKNCLEEQTGNSKEEKTIFN